MEEAATGAAATGVSARMLADGGVRFETDGQRATITLTRPERRNAVTAATWRALAEIGARLPPEVRVVVVRGDGPSFCAGIDVRVFQGGVPGDDSFGDLTRLADDDLDRRIAGAQAGYAWLRRPEIVSIAAVQGHAIGAGFQLALACDLRVLADDAQLCMKEPSLGLVPDLGGTKRLVDVVAVPRATEICLTGRRVAAAEAGDLGLAELVVNSAELDQAVDDLTAALLATPREAATATKALLQEAPGRSLSEQLAAERRAQAARLRTLFAAG